MAETLSFSEAARATLVAKCALSGLSSFLLLTFFLCYDLLLNGIKIFFILKLSLRSLDPLPSGKQLQSAKSRGSVQSMSSEVPAQGLCPQGGHWAGWAPWTTRTAFLWKPLSFSPHKRR